jgi:hypothetical protein
VIGRKDIKTVPTAIRTIIEWAQPYNTITDRPNTDALAVLADLTNFDKHRNLTTTACYGGMPWVAHSDADIDITYSGEGKPLATDKETEVMTFVVRGPEAKKMKVYPDFAYEVRIERVTRGKRIQRVGLVSTLESIAARVVVVIDAVEGRHPLPVWRRPAI